MTKISLVLVLSCAFSAVPALAWGPLGHKVIARVAQERLSPDALAGVRGLLGESADLAEISNCADGILYTAAPMPCGPFTLAPAEFKTAGPWHYLDLPLIASTGTSAVNEEPLEAEGRPLDQIRARVETLKDRSASRKDKQIALMLVVHLVGDIHMPLHVRIDMNDKGGNKAPVVFMGVDKSLHALWDDLIMAEDWRAQGTMDTGPWLSRVRAIVNGGASGNVGDWTYGDYLENAGWESVVLAGGVIYPEYVRQQTLGSDYQEMMQPVVAERLAKASVRLAGVLNDAFANSPCAPPLGAVNASKRATKVMRETTLP